MEVGASTFSRGVYNSIKWLFYFLQASIPFGAPPVLPRLQSQVQYFLENPQLLPIHDLELVQQHWKKDVDTKQICKVDALPPPTMLLIGRDPVTGVMSDLDEILVPHAGMTNKTSMSMLRTPGRLSDSPFNSQYFHLSI